MPVNGNPPASITGVMASVSRNWPKNLA